MGLDDFSITDVIAEGAIGRILLAHDKRIERDVAIKELKEERLTGARDRVIARFVREAKITGQLEHPGIVPVYEISYKQDGTPFYVMKHVRGRTLHEALISCKAASNEASLSLRLTLLDKFITVCEAVAYAHSKGIIHRDLKLGNIILGDFGEVAVIDWGLAKRFRTETDEAAPSIPHDIREDDTLKTIDGAILGTPSYMPPEQIDRKFGDVDERSDVYSLGVILFAILTGGRPYKEKGEAVLKLTTGGTPSPRASDRLDLVPPPLSAICEKAMAKDKDRRFASAGELARELISYRDGRLVSVYAYSKKELFKRFVSRNRAAVAAAAGIMAAVIIGSAVSVDFAVDANRARRSAENALINVTGLAESAAKLAEDMSIRLETHLTGLPPKKLDSAINALSSELPSMIGLDPRDSMYQVWLMDPDGRILYDEDSRQIGLDLFTDATYASFPELLALGSDIREKSWGIGYYSFYNREGKVIYKVAAWDTSKVGGRQLRIVVTYPYIYE